MVSAPPGRSGRRNNANETFSSGVWAGPHQSFGQGRTSYRGIQLDKTHRVIYRAPRNSEPACDTFIREMARDYGVSTQALTIRLKGLGYIQE
jgi:hypothetical protein